MTEQSETREILQRRLETQLKEWSTRIDHLKAEAERDMADAELREQLYERLQKLRDMQRVAMGKLEELKRSGKEAWKSAKKDIDRLAVEQAICRHAVLPQLALIGEGGAGRSGVRRLEQRHSNSRPTMRLQVFM